MKMTREGSTLLDLYRQEFEPADSRKDAEKAVRLLVTARLNNNQYSAPRLPRLWHQHRHVPQERAPLKMINRGENLSAAAAFTNFAYVTDDAGRRVLDPSTLKHRELQKDLFLTPELVRRSKRSVC